MSGNTRNSRPVFVQGGKIFIYDPANEEYDEIDSQNLVSMVNSFGTGSGEQVDNSRLAIVEAKLDYLINALSHTSHSSSESY